MLAFLEIFSQIDLQIALTLAIVVLMLTAFVREWASPDIIAMTVLGLLVGVTMVLKAAMPGHEVAILDVKQMLEVFSNDAPLTIGCLFVIGGALESTGAVDHIGKFLKTKLSGSTRGAIFAFTVVAAFFSAWMNNTAIVAILMPMTLGFARSKDIPASKLLIPLSYSSIIGGCCTLIGTSTNLLVNGTLQKLDITPMSMFELAPIGVPLAVAVIFYLTFFGPKLLPSRASITGSLDITYRTTPLYHILVGGDSKLIGKKLLESELADRATGVHIMEIRRGGARVMKKLSELTVEKNDRYMIALHRRRGGAAKPAELFERIGAEVLSQVDGIVSELVIRDESSLIGFTMAEADFRQRFNSVVLAVHRNGVNITNQIADLPLEIGDTLLVITAHNNLESLKMSREFVMTDLLDESAETSTETVRQHRPKRALAAWAVLIGVVGMAAGSDIFSSMVSWIPKIPIYYAALIGVLALLWTKIVTPRDAYGSVDWPILFMLYGLLGLGAAMENSGTGQWLAHGLVGIVENFVSSEMLPTVLLWVLFLLTLLLTEMLSNNATAVMMVPIGVTVAHQIGVNPRPFIIGLTIASSCAFMLPIGYQTHMMVYGPGGYKLSDFVRVGVPLDFCVWVIACTLIPMIWHF